VGWDDDLGPVCAVLGPERPATPFVFSSPHSGRIYPRRFLDQARLHPSVLRRSEDMHVDDLIGGVVALGAPLLLARFPRAYVDVNREPYELDPRMFEGRLPAHANTRSVRVASGLGAIPRIVGDCLEIYAGRLPVEEAMARIAACHAPFHAALTRLLTDARRRFGLSVLIDCHSMPSASVDRESSAIDLVIGDRYGTSASAALMDRLEGEARRRGFRVSRNRPYAGGYITETYGAPEMGRHAVQVEINRGLYMDEATGERLPGFAELRAALDGIFASLLDTVVAPAAPPRLAAE
jgi:N-formylglutamate amidohydrolase